MPSVICATPKMIETFILYELKKDILFAALCLCHTHTRTDSAEHRVERCHGVGVHPVRPWLVPGRVDAERVDGVVPHHGGAVGRALSHGPRGLEEAEGDGATLVVDEALCGERRASGCASHM